MRLFRQCLYIAACCCITGQAFAQSEDTELDPLEAYRGQTVMAIRIQGAKITRDYVIGREIWTDEGKPLDPDLVREDVTRLENLSIFGSVVVKPTAVEGGVELNFEFTEMPWLIPYPALKYTEENGFSIGAGLSSPNFQGKDVTLSTSVLVGGTTTFNFSAANPWVSGNHLSYLLKAWHMTRDNVVLEFKETSDLVALQGGSYIGQSGRASLGVAYYAVTSDRDSITIDPDKTDNMWVAFGDIGYDKRDSWRVPHDGWWSRFTPSYLGGDANAWGLQFDVRRYQPIAARHTIATGPLFSFQSGEVGTDLPSYMQLFLGGVNTIRGYHLAELGKEIFGKNQFLYTLEYRYLLVPIKAYRILKWSFGFGFELAAFGDFGIAWTGKDEFNWDRTRFGYGAGFRALVPSIGMVRFDIGVSEFGDVLFHFGIGSIFDARAKKIR